MITSCWGSDEVHAVPLLSLQGSLPQQRIVFMQEFSTFHGKFCKILEKIKIYARNLENPRIFPTKKTKTSVNQDEFQKSCQNGKKSQNTKLQAL